MSATNYSVGQVAGFAGTTVRTLHHYDEIGLLVPSERNHAGHRRYSEQDLDRLQQILFYRELGFPLDEVHTLLDDPSTDPRVHLKRQHDVLVARIEKLQKMAEAVEHAMEAQKMGIQLTPEERFEVFGDKDPEQYQQEAEERWGGTEAYAESQRRAATYTKDDWARISTETEDWGVRYAALVAAGEDAEGERAMDLAEEHRQHISRWYFDVSYEMHVCFGDMYVADERFKAFYDAMGEGVAEHLRDAIHANAVRRS
ncbi:MerR family transcriptional regulator [Streptomyces sp. SID8379]|uniref:MerR family transcriptional regulator n=1 Tax=unclassified Streptomyces TaxID=2593676 RepID=UPI00037987C0|nr:MULTISPECIES: TipAS antibiotic-recognition domain-containing protein [unclassified Streptomyces]MYW70296.1 MerR family transcriptional regulator [Streptomyces sp. SID8379]